MNNSSGRNGMPDTPLTLMDLLNSRENRASHQRELLEKYTSFNCDAVLISMTLNIPGPVKDKPEYRKALETGIHRLKAMFLSPSDSPAGHEILHEEFRPLRTGPEGYMVVTGDPLEIKKAAVAAEEADALGRLFDMDVLVLDADSSVQGTPHAVRGISRSQLGAEPRKCLLCGEDAKACARSRTHSMDHLLEKINQILSDAGL